MKKFILHVFLLLLLVAVCSRCKHLRDQDDPSNDCYYDGSVEGLKEWYYYKVGTYWIYEDVNSGMRDTLTVTFNEESAEGANFASCKFTSFSTYYNGFINVYFNDSYTIHCLNHQSCDCRKIRWGFYSIATGVNGGDWTFLYPHIPNNYSYLHGGITKLLSYNQEIMVHNSIYQQVVVYDVNKSFIEGPQDEVDSGTQVYFTIAKNHFIIRKQVPEYNQDWQLIEHVIIQ